MAGSREPSGRFAPGHTGNPDGRPRRRKSKKQDVSAYDVLEGRRINIVIGGSSRELRMEEALFHRTYQDALSGSLRAVRAIIKRINEREAERSPQTARRVIIASEFPNPANVDDALCILGIASRSADGVREGGAPFLQLEPWAVKAGLARRTIPPLGQEALKGIRRQTRDPDLLNWPEGGD